ncbi:MAG: nucleotidyltransferase family protein [Bacteroidia bacterium]
MQINSIKELILSVLKNYPIKKAAIFGSFARNEANDESDIDLLIEPSKSITIFDVLRLERDLSKVTSRKIDVVEYTAIKSSIRSNILKDAIVIL